MWQLGPVWRDEEELARAWRAAAPFSYLVFDDFVADAALPRMFEVLEEEAVERYQGDIFVFDATTPEPQTAAFRELRDQLGELLAAPLSRVTGKHVQRVDMRAYAYRPGHYLLPHTDHQEGLERALAFAYYLPSPEPPAGGELELYACETEGDEITEVTSARVIEPRANRLVVFDVGDVSLHQVREVLGGLRLSLAGWFYP